MNDKLSFADTNVLIYAVDVDGPKKQIALQLLLTGPIISIQIVNECTNVLRKKLKLDYRRVVQIMNNYLQKVTLVPVTLQTVNLAWELGEKYGYSYYDSLVLASVLENECTTFYSEDLQHGQLIENSLHIVNPFI
jgi:predicted nucleic acid-binding protein